MMEHDLHIINSSIDKVINGVNVFLDDLDKNDISIKNRFYYAKVCLHHIIPLFISYFDKCRRYE